MAEKRMFHTLYFACSLSTHTDLPASFAPSFLNFLGARKLKRKTLRVGNVSEYTLQPEKRSKTELRAVNKSINLWNMSGKWDLVHTERNVKVKTIQIQILSFLPSGNRVVLTRTTLSNFTFVFTPWLRVKGHAGCRLHATVTGTRIVFSMVCGP